MLLPNLFNLYTEKIFGVEGLKGANIGGVNIKNLRYADDTALLAEVSYGSTSLTNSCE